MRKCLTILLVSVLFLALAATANANASFYWRLGANGPGFNSAGAVSGKGMQQGAAAGLGVMRNQMIEGTSSILTSQMDVTVSTYAKDNLMVYPMLGIPAARKGASYLNDSTTLNAFLYQFARRYGPNGAFWSQYPTLPYHPVTQFEIGNEPNTTTGTCGVADQTNLHYTDPSQFAYVYKRARQQIHTVQPTARVIVGGLAPCGALPSIESWLTTFLQTSGPVDSVGWHPYVFGSGNSLPTFQAMSYWTQALHNTLVSDGFSSTMLDVNEFDSNTSFTDSATWGSNVAAFTKWALCTPSAGVADVQPEWWGGKAGADANPLFPLAHDPNVNGAVTLTAYGTAYLNMTRRLTGTAGCS